MDEVCAFVSTVYDPGPWVCFSMLWESSEALSDAQLAMRTRMEIRKVRASLACLHEDRMIERIGPQLHGRWTVEHHTTAARIVDRLRTLRVDKTEHEDALVCVTCNRKVQLVEIVAQLASEDLHCPHCDSSLQDVDTCDDAASSIEEWIDRIQRFSRRMTDWAPCQTFLPTPQ